jgi:dienelactone hydrolase
MFSKSMHIGFPMLSVLALIVGCQQVQSVSADKEIIQYTSYNPEFIKNIFDGSWNDDRSYTLKGNLILPKGQGPFPVVVFQHGSGVPNHWNYRDWYSKLTEKLISKDIALVMADSYSGRGIGETSKDQSKLSKAARITDVFMLLKALNNHPKIDATRSGIMGTSFGGIVSWMATSEDIASALMSGELRYGAHVPLYPSCQTMMESYKPTDAPVLFLAGAEDDYTEFRYCKELIEQMKGAGAKVEAIVYPNAGHGFISSKPYSFNSQAMHFNDCGRGKITSEGYSLSEFKGKTIGSKDTWAEYIKDLAASKCAKRGVHIGRNEFSATDSLDKSVDFFANHLK